MQSIVRVALKGPFTEFHRHTPERPFQGQMPSLPASPGLRPGLAETAFQAEKSFTALLSGAEKTQLQELRRGSEKFHYFPNGADASNSRRAANSIGFVK